MLKAIFSSKNKEDILLYITAREEAYAREIARFYDTDLSPVQNQLEKLENGAILYSRMVGRTRVYKFNPRYPFINELKSLLTKAIEFLPEEEKKKLLYERKRPRRKGKEL